MDEKLYSKEDGTFLFRGKKLGQCALCRSKDYCYDVGSLAPHSRFCRGCILTEGPKNLRRDSNIALRNAKTKVDALKTEWDALQKRYRERFGYDLKLHRE